MAWHSHGWSNSLDTKLHPLSALDARNPLRFARIVLQRPAQSMEQSSFPADDDIAVVELEPGWEHWRVSYLREVRTLLCYEMRAILSPYLLAGCCEPQQAEILLASKRQGRSDSLAPQIAYLTDLQGGALYTHDTLGDLEIVPRRRAASVDLLAVPEGERPIHVVSPSAEQCKM